MIFHKVFVVVWDLKREILVCFPTQEFEKWKQKQHTDTEVHRINSNQQSSLQQWWCYVSCCVFEQTQPESRLKDPNDAVGWRKDEGNLAAST